MKIVSKFNIRKGANSKVGNKASFTGKFIAKQTIVKDYSIAAKIINSYNLKILEKILEGQRYEFLGYIYIVKVINKTSHLKCLSGATKRIREQTGDKSLIIYRTNEDYHKIFWSGQYKYSRLKLNLVQAAYLRIPLYESRLISAPIYNK